MTMLFYDLFPVRLLNLITARRSPRAIDTQYSSEYPRTVPMD